MSDTNCWITISFLLAFGMTVVARAQEKDVPPQAKDQGREQTKKTESPKKPRPARKGLSPGQVLVLRFDRAAPQIGDPLPDAAGLDADGKEFKLRSLKGHYTVLTFGCLT